MSRSRRGILVIQSLGVGDLLFAVPVLRVLRRAYPDEPLTFLTHARAAELLTLVPEVSDTLHYRAKTPRALWRLLVAVRRRRYRLAIVLNPLFRGALLAWLAGIPVRVGYQRDYERRQSMWGTNRLLLTHSYAPREAPMHEVDRYIELLTAFGITIHPEDRRPRLVLTEAVRAFGQDVLTARPSTHRGPVVMIHPGAGWVMRQWPADRVAAIADWLVAQYDARVVFIGSGHERPLVERIQAQMQHPVLSCVGHTTLPQLAGLLAQAQVFLAHDTGPLHIAAALDVPTVALFGPGDPVKVRPRAETATILHHPMPWGPCRVQYTTRCQSNLCMQAISVDEVAAALARLLGGDPSLAALSSRPLAGPPQRILYLQSTAEISGTDLTLLRTLEILDRTRFEPHVVLQREGPFGEAYRRAGARVHILPMMRQLRLQKGLGYLMQYLLGYPVAVVQIARLARRERITLIHSNTLHNLYGFLAARLAGVPHVWHVREIVVGAPIVRAIERWLVQRFSTKFIVMNRVIAQEYQRRGGGLPRQIVVLYDGVDLELFHPSVSGVRIRRELGVGEQAPLIGTVCRLDPWKGLELFLEAAALVHRARPDARFLVCGGEIEGREGYEAVLRRRASALGLDGLVFFTGWRYRHRDIPEVYGALDVSVQCPTTPEPYGLANVEAMACGVPIVAAAHGGPTELCVPNETALLVPPGDARAAAEATRALLQDPDRARAMRAAGRRRAERLFDRRRCVRELEVIYEGILGGRAC